MLRTASATFEATCRTCSNGSLRSPGWVKFKLLTFPLVPLDKIARQSCPPPPAARSELSRTRRSSPPTLVPLGCRRHSARSSSPESLEARRPLPAARGLPLLGPPGQRAGSGRDSPRGGFMRTRSVVPAERVGRDRSFLHEPAPVEDFVRQWRRAPTHLGRLKPGMGSRDGGRDAADQALGIPLFELQVLFGLKSGASRGLVPVAGRNACAWQR